MCFPVLSSDIAAVSNYLHNRPVFARIRPRILHSVVGTLFAKEKNDEMAVGYEEKALFL